MLDWLNKDILSKAIKCLYCFLLFESDFLLRYLSFNMKFIIRKYSEDLLM